MTAIVQMEARIDELTISNMVRYLDAQQLIKRPMGHAIEKGQVSPAFLLALGLPYTACTGIDWRVSMMRLSASTYTSSGA